MRFNVLIPFPLLAILALLLVAYYVTGLTGVTMFAVIGALAYLTPH